MEPYDRFKATFGLPGLTLVILISIPAHLKADFEFGTPTNLGATINSSADEYCVDVSDDGLCLVFSDSPFSWRSGGRGNIDIWMATRDTTDEPFGPPVNVTELNTSYHDFSPTLSTDGLSVFFSSNRPGGRGDMDLWMATRPSKTAPFPKPVNLGSTVNSGAGDFCPCLSADGLELYFNSSRWGGYGGSCDVYVAKRATPNSAWRTPVNLGSRINTSHTEGNPQISADGLTLFYSSSKSGGYGQEDLWVVTRASTSAAWGTPVNLGPGINTSGKETSISIWEDGYVMFFVSGRSGGVGQRDIWQVPIIPVLDFDGSGQIDMGDFTRLAQHWRHSESSVDIAPAALGDGKVNLRDLVVLAEYWLNEIGLVAHWKLDETEGYVAHESVGDNDGFVLSANPLWRPADGKIRGALELDGIDDFVSVPFVLDPADGAFSVFAWIKGRAAGQVVLSQIGAANWLGADAEGKLMTELKGTGRFAGPLRTETVITDGRWRRVGLTWDGSNRILYVDDVEAAKDTQSSLAGSQGGLYIGAGKDRELGSLWSGLIDDIKIYDRAIVP
jgi:hypothetical protein